MVPRWRSLAATLRSNELGASSPTEKKPSRVLSHELRERLEKWRRQPSLLSNAELVETAIVEGEDHEAIGAARSILSNFASAAPLLRKQAQQLLIRAGQESIVTGEAGSPAIGHWRRQTRIHPEDALAWVELALHQTIAREPEKAERSMRVALQLAPNNRHVLRAACRLFLHLNDAEHAHDLLLRSPATRADPWLIAAEIAISELAERHPQFYKQGLELVQGGHLLPRHLTELAGAVGTAEMVGGNRRKARKMFGQSMVDPTGNSLAQAEWAIPGIGSDVVPVMRLKTVREAFEAKAFHYYREEKYREVLDFCEGWASEEPYSIRPFEFGATTAGQIDEFERAVTFADRGLRMRPRAPKLLNASAFALASTGKLEDAEHRLRRTPGRC